MSLSNGFNHGLYDLPSGSIVAKAKVRRNSSTACYGSEQDGACQTATGLPEPKDLTGRAESMALPVKTSRTLMVAGSASVIGNPMVEAMIVMAMAVAVVVNGCDDGVVVVDVEVWGLQV